MSKDTIIICTSQDRSKGGKTRAAKLSPQQRSAIAKKASHSRKCMIGLPKATHSGVLSIAGSQIQCDVLEDGRRMIRKGAIQKAMGKARASGKDIMRSKSMNLPVFVCANNLLPYFEKDFLNRSHEIEYKSCSGIKCIGYEANILPESCKIYVKADDDGALEPQQKPIANICRAILYSLATVGITSLIDEITGYELVKEDRDLQQLFEKFLHKELQPWLKRFPDHFFENLKKMYGLDQLKKTPSFAGHFINRFIYDELSPEIRQELDRLNPKNDKGYRQGRHHQLLTEDIGCPALEKQIQKVSTLMSISDSKEEFEKFLEKTKKVD